MTTKDGLPSRPKRPKRGSVLRAKGVKKAKNNTIVKAT